MDQLGRSEHKAREGDLGRSVDEFEIREPREGDEFRSGGIGLFDLFDGLVRCLRGKRTSFRKKEEGGKGREGGRTHLKVEEQALGGDVGVMNFVFEPQTLTDQKLERENILRCGPSVAREGIDRN